MKEFWNTIQLIFAGIGGWLVISHIKKVGTEDFSCRPFVL